jgi:hypothetical protein
MARKRQEGVSTQDRYKLKMYRVFATGVPESLAMSVAESISTARAQGIGAFRTAKQEARAVLGRMEVPSALWGLYLAYTNELVRKVQIRKEATRDQIVEKWTEYGLNPTVLNAIADEVGVEVKTTQTKPAPKT